MAGLIKRGKKFYAVYRIGGKEKRRSLGTDSRQIALEKIRQLESRMARGDDNPLPTRTPVAEVVAAYVQHIQTVKTYRSARTDIYYLREAFGPICPALEITSRKVSQKARKRRLLPSVDLRCNVPTIGGQLLGADHHRPNLGVRRRPGPGSWTGPQDGQPAPRDTYPAFQLGHGAARHPLAR